MRDIDAGSNSTGSNTEGTDLLQPSVSADGPSSLSKPRENFLPQASVELDEAFTGVYELLLIATQTASVRVGYLGGRPLQRSE